MKKMIFGCFLLLILAIGLSSCNSLKSYTQAKNDTMTLFNREKDEFIKAKNTVVDKKTDKDVHVKKISSIDYENIDSAECVFFDFGAQGMLGGQYWGVYYSSDNIPKVADNGNQSEPRLTEAETDGCYFWQEPNGNNYYATERISDNWFFYYLDYDGNRHGLNWRSK